MADHFPIADKAIYNNVSNIVSLPTQIAALTNGQIYVPSDDDSDTDHESVCVDVTAQNQISDKNVAVGLRLPDKHLIANPQHKLLCHFVMNANINTPSNGTFDHIQPQLLTALTEPVSNVGTYTSLFILNAQYQATTNPESVHVNVDQMMYLNPTDLEKLYLGFEFKAGTASIIDNGSKISVVYNIWESSIPAIGKRVR